MQKDVKIGLIVGVIILALVVIVWAKYSGESKPVVTQAESKQNFNDFMAQWETAGGAKGKPAEATTPGATASAPAAAPAPTPASGASAAPAATETAPAASEPQRIHVVEKGDSLWSIAKKYYNDSSKMKLILDANHATVPNEKATLKIGQKLVIPPDTATAKSSPPAATPTASAAPAVSPTPGAPVGAGASSAPGTPVTLTIPDGGDKKVVKHTLAKNDMLWDLAQKYYGDGSKWKRILDANKDVIKSEHNLPVGKVIVIPMDK